MISLQGKPSRHEVAAFCGPIFGPVLLGVQAADGRALTHQLPAFLLLVLFRQYTGSERGSGSILDSAT